MPMLKQTNNYLDKPTTILNSAVYILQSCKSHPNCFLHC